jgi:NAD(P)-dependent dehydrogenase (short-subunit alcohol dehydrogenase family)
VSNYLEKLFSLKGKVALVTGSSRGIGSEIAHSFLKSGANVICVSRSKFPLKKELKQFYRQCDVTNVNQFKEVCESINRQYGGIDILINAAGITFTDDDNCTEFERFNKTLDINLKSIFYCCNTASEFMHNGGSIVNITSIGSMLGFPNNPGYVASKGGVMALTKAIAIDFSLKNIRVNNIAPGYIKTDMTLKSYENKVERKKRIDRMIIKRWGEVDDIVGAAIFLASDASCYMTGTDLIIDGGWTAKGI